MNKGIKKWRREAGRFLGETYPRERDQQVKSPMRKPVRGVQEVTRRSVELGEGRGGH